MSNKILVVEDDLELAEALSDSLEIAGYETLSVGSGEAALSKLGSIATDLILTDVNMPGMDGHQLLKEVRQRYPAIPVILMTAFGQVDKAVAAMRAGASDYLMKPFDVKQLLDAVAPFLGGTRIDVDQPIAEDASSQQLLQLARRVAASESNVLITGESGTGKEVLARYIHQNSPRSGQPFVAINCAAIPENMLESLLFGHEKGAFTGAIASIPGKFEQANGGTLLLDEISEMAIGLQAKLLRVLQEQEVERVGGRKMIPINVRVLATSNRQLEQSVADGNFREDLYYRLNVFPLSWKPLRERINDIPPLAEKLLLKHCEKQRRTPARFDASALAVLQSHPWSGNVRELDNVVQRALILQSGNIISDSDLMLGSTAPQTDGESSPIEDFLEEDLGNLGAGLQQKEFQLILDALAENKGSRKQAAEQLGISPRTLRYKLAKMRESGIDLRAVLGSG